MIDALAIISDNFAALWFSGVLVPVVVCAIVASPALHVRFSALGIKAGIFSGSADQGKQRSAPVVREVAQQLIARALSQEVLSPGTSEKSVSFEWAKRFPSMPEINFDDLRKYFEEPWCCLSRTHNVDTDVLDEVVMDSLTAKRSEADFRDCRPDFSGKWCLARVEGNPDQIAYNAGVSKPKRLAGAALGWGIGHVYMTVCQQDDQLHLTSTTPIGSGHTQVTVGNGPQWATASDGGQYQCEPNWEGSALVCNNFRGGVATTTRRYMQNDATIIETKIDGYYANAVLVEVYTRV